MNVFQENLWQSLPIPAFLLDPGESIHDHVDALQRLNTPHEQHGRYRFHVESASSCLAITG